MYPSPFFFDQIRAPPTTYVQGNNKQRLWRPKPQYGSTTFACIDCDSWKDRRVAQSTLDTWVSHETD